MKNLSCALFLLFWIPAAAYAYDDGDFQIWGTDTQEFGIRDNSKIAIEEEFRWADNANEFYYHHYDAGFSYTIQPRFTIGGGYRHIYELKRGKFKQENAPYLTATFSWDLAGLTCEDRSRVEYRHFGYQADAGRYRNKLTLKLPFKFTSLQIQPYVSDEIFMSFGGINQCNQNRASAGLSARLTKATKAEVYYLLQSTKSAGTWRDVNVLGTKIKTTF